MISNVTTFQPVAQTTPADKVDIGYSALPRGSCNSYEMNDCTRPKSPHSHLAYSHPDIASRHP